VGWGGGLATPRLEGRSPPAQNRKGQGECCCKGQGECCAACVLAEEGDTAEETNSTTLRESRRLSRLLAEEDDGEEEDDEPLRGVGYRLHQQIKAETHGEMGKQELCAGFFVGVVGD